MEQIPETGSALYQVFINHRGPDVKKSLASLIYHRLRSCGLSVFLDEKEIRTGDTLSSAIFGAIQSASVHVAIFSERYAESSWCLEELCCILKTSHERNTNIIPVFWDVEPSELRHIESGRYAKAFEKHQLKGRVATEVIQNWKTALDQASQISGLPFKANESDYGEILEKIVEIVFKEVFKCPELEIAQYPVGLDQAAEDFLNEILKHSHSNATAVVGIAGMGGVGKSTIAKHLYNLRCRDFSRSSILCEVRKGDLQSLQKKLLSDLLGNYNLPQIHSISHGKRILRDCLPRLPPIFVVMDDVDNMDQIESLLDVDAVVSGSLILITSRDKDLLRRSSSKAVVHDVKPLHKNHARELFHRHAFSQSNPSEELEDLVEEFLKICGGLPLSLKVLGGLFVGRCDKAYWKRQLEKLSTALPLTILNSLKVSYEALDPEEKEVFLDIGCFLAGEEKELVIRVLEGLYDNNRIGDYLESLRQKCLLDFSDGQRQIPRMDFCNGMSGNEIECRKRKYPMIEYNDTCKSITMHDQLRGLARHIAREEFRVFPTRNPLRLSSSTDLFQVRRHSQGVSRFQVRGIRFSQDEHPQIGGRDVWVEGVRLFVVDFGDLSYWPWNMSGELVWLRLRSSTCRLSLFSMCLRRLRVLEIQSPGARVEQFFDEHHNDLPRHLTELNIVCTEPKSSRNLWARIPTVARQTESSGQSSGQGRSLISRSRQNESSFFRYLENYVTGMKTLTSLVLTNLGFLQSLPVDFSQLQNLRHLDLSGCNQLTELPDTISQLLQLQYLALQHCFNLSIPKYILGEISTLEYVDFKGCTKLICLPERIPYQTHLRYLNLLGTGLLQLPDNLERLDKLEQLTIGSPALKEIPLTVANLRGLTELFLIQCPSLHRILTEGIAAPNLKILAIDGCPIDYFSLQDQGNLDVENIHLRVSISFLRDLILTNTNICQISLPNCVFPRLENIDLSENIRLIRVNALPSELVSLNLQNCRGLKTLRGLSNLINLKFLNIYRCFNLETLNIEGLASLEDIKAEECWELQRIEGLNQGERLNCLRISTDNRIIWDDICQFFRSPIHREPSTVILSGRANNNKMFGEGDMLRIVEKFNLQMFDIVYRRSKSVFSSPQVLENFCSHGAILVCFITNDVKSRQFSVAFSPYYFCVSLNYSISVGNRGGRGVHLFMWIDESRLFKEYSAYRDIYVSFAHGYWTEACSSNVEEETGWMLMVDKKTDVSEVCREFIMACA